jgi:VanZ family protein
LDSHNDDRRGLTFWISAWLPVALAIVIIAVESTPYFGADRTDHPLRWIWEAVFGQVSNAQWGQVHILIRKSGHFVGYGLIGLIWLRAWRMTLPRSGFALDAALALIGTAMVASADEYHQTWLPNRTGTPWDVLLDCCGAIALQLVFYIFFRLSSRKRLAVL